jgi:hypothetical protein
MLMTCDLWHAAFVRFIALPIDFEGTAPQMPGVSFKATLTRISD